MQPVKSVLKVDRRGLGNPHPKVRPWTGTPRGVGNRGVQTVTWLSGCKGGSALNLHL
jgi:hypothetical protein